MFRCFIVFFLVFLNVNLFGTSPSASFNKLVEGNTRFVKNKQTNSNQNSDLRLSQAEAQNPFAVIVACADSRVAPEILFDQGIGDLFVIRVAGNVIGPFELESIEYAVKYLKSSCVVVMGHENCGAVDAVIKRMTKDIPFIAQMIWPAVLKAEAVNPSDLLKTSIEFNAEAMSQFLLKSSIVSDLKDQNKVDVKAAYYDFQSGKVTFL